MLGDISRYDEFSRPALSFRAQMKCAPSAGRICDGDKRAENIKS
jgi:hypothetical protein